MAVITGKYSSATAYSVTLSSMTIGTVYAILIQDLNSDGSSNGYDCVWKSGATNSTVTLNRTATATFSKYPRKIGFFQGTFNTSVGTHITDAQFNSWADGTGTISAWGGGGSTGYVLQADSDSWPSILSSVYFADNTSITQSNKSCSFANTKYIRAISLTSSGLAWSGTIYWSSSSGGTTYPIADITDGSISYYDIEPIDFNNKSRTIYFTAIGQTTYKYRIHAMTTADDSYFSGGSQDYYAPSSSTWYSSNTVSNTFDLDTLPKPIRAHYKLVGWAYTNTTDTSQAHTGEITVSGTTDGKVNNFYAVWSLAPTIVLSANGGVFQDTQSATKEYPRQTPGNAFYFSGPSGLVARNGYKLLGWSASDTATTATYDRNGWVTVGNSTVQRYYAVWQKSEATITLYGNGGLWGGNLQHRSLKKNVGDVINLADYGPNGTPPLGRAYYSLIGWSTSSTGTVTLGINGKIIVGAADASYYAIWKPHIELFYWDGGTGATDDSIIAKGLPVTNLTASRWNKFKKKINEITQAQTGKVWSYTTTYPEDPITAIEVLNARNAIAALNGHVPLPTATQLAPEKEILASYFNGKGSLKDALNIVISNYNG